MNKKVIVIDLDGTFVSVNTFHKWMKFLLVESLKSFNLMAILKILKSASLRYLKLIDHSQMKFSILKISEKSIKHKQCVSFVQSLEPYVHKELFKVLQENNITILATAAPLLYAEVIKEHYHFDYVIATKETNDTNWKENIREKKKENLMQLLQQHSLSPTIDILYTDHHDDLPLMLCAKTTYLINPSKTTKQLVSQKVLNIKTIHYLL